MAKRSNVAYFEQRLKAHRQRIEHKAKPSKRLVPEDRVVSVKKSKREQSERALAINQMSAGARKAAETLAQWMPNFTRDMSTSVWRVVASLPFGDEAEDLGFKPLTSSGWGWKEVELISDVLSAMQGQADVEGLIAVLLGADEEEDL